MSEQKIENRDSELKNVIYNSLNLRLEKFDEYLKELEELDNEAD